MILANQADFRPISKTQLDVALGVHRSTRIRLFKELREIGLIKGNEQHVLMADPRPILKTLKDARLEAHQTMDETVLRDGTPAAPVKPQEPKEKPDFFQAATDAWNAYRPTDYAKVRKLSAGLLQAIDAHIKALNIEPHDYESFFSVLKAGVELSNFWSSENSCKTLQSIVGFGNPQTKKFTNVYQLYNEGLDAPESKPLQEHERKDQVVYPRSYRKLIDGYDEAQYHYYQVYFKSDEARHAASLFVIEKEKALIEVGLDPAKFRMMHHSCDVVDWPTDVPSPDKPREIFWTYRTDE